MATIQRATLRINPSGSYKLRLVISRDKKYSGKRIQLGLRTRDRACALLRSRYIVEEFRRAGVCRNITFRCICPELPTEGLEETELVWHPGMPEYRDAAMEETALLVKHCLKVALTTLAQ